MTATTLTYSAPCTACGETDHDRTACEYRPTSVRVGETSLPDVHGWRATITYRDGITTTSELSWDPRARRFEMFGVIGTDGRWHYVRWTGRQPVDRTLSGARAYALAFFNGADLPPTEENGS
jgi:hypothetical protein